MKQKRNFEIFCRKNVLFQFLQKKIESINLKNESKIENFCVCRKEVLPNLRKSRF